MHHGWADRLSMAAHNSNIMMKIPLSRRTLKRQRRASKSKDWASVETLHGTSRNG